MRFSTPNSSFNSNLQCPYFLPSLTTPLHLHVRCLDSKKLLLRCSINVLSTVSNYADPDYVANREHIAALNAY